MDFVRQTINSAELNSIVNLPMSLRNSRVEIIVLPLADATASANPKTKRQIGFAQGAEIPDSFFEPLPEEELQLWGL